jgi:hypothetical protein
VRVDATWPLGRYWTARVSISLKALGDAYMP